MPVSAMKLPQLAYCNCINIGLLLHPFMVVVSSLKWPKLHSFYHLFSHAQNTLFGKILSGKSDEILDQ